MFTKGVFSNGSHSTENFVSYTLYFSVVSEIMTCVCMCVCVHVRVCVCVCVCTKQFTGTSKECQNECEGGNKCLAVASLFEMQQTARGNIGFIQFYKTECFMARIQPCI